MIQINGSGRGVHCSDVAGGDGSKRLPYMDGDGNYNDKQDAGSSGVGLPIYIKPNPTVDGAGVREEFIKRIRENCHSTFMGGYTHDGDEEKYKAFVHGMDTVCNVLEGRLSRLHSRIDEEVEKEIAEDKEFRESDDIPTSRFYRGKKHGMDMTVEKINQAFKDL